MGGVGVMGVMGVVGVVVVIVVVGFSVIPAKAGIPYFCG
jgi:hypothetical protein